jgi:hypothetical protein
MSALPQSTAASGSLPELPGASAGVPSPNPVAAGATLDLRDIHLPPDPGLWPPAPGWWLLAGMMIVLLAIAALLGRRTLLKRRRRHSMLMELGRLDGSEVTGPQLAAGVSEVLKRVALTRYPRAEVASLTGESWLAFLDRTGGGGRFSNGPGRVLASAPYAPERTDASGMAIDSAGLLAAARRWVRHNS